MKVTLRAVLLVTAILCGGSLSASAEDIDPDSARALQVLCSANQNSSAFSTCIGFLKGIITMNEYFISLGKPHFIICPKGSMLDAADNYVEFLRSHPEELKYGQVQSFVDSMRAADPSCNR